MTRPTHQAQIPTSVLGQVGLLLMLMVARLVPAAYTPQGSAIGRSRGFLARRALDGIAVIGWCVDHVPPPVCTGAAGAGGMRASRAPA